MIGRRLKPYLMVAPAIVLIAAFSIYPICYMAYLSLFKWNMLGPKVFVGLRNYIDLISSRDFYGVLGNTLYFTVLSVALSLSLSLAAALLLRRNTGFNRFLQGAIFAPYVIPLVSVSFIWIWFMDFDYGLLNYALGLIGIRPIDWLSDPRYALTSLAVVSVWKSLGFDTIIMASALQSIPPYLYEAATLDRAGPFVKFRAITLPMLSPTLFFLTLTNVIAALKSFETVAIMTQGGPGNATNTLVHYIYQNGFQFFKIGYASAIGVVMALFIGLITIAYFWALERRVHYR